MAAAMPTDAPRILSFYRVDPRKRMGRVLVLGPGVLTLGGVIIALSFLTQQAERTRVGAATAGFVLIAGGAAYTMVAMQLILRDELLLVVRTDGVVIQAGGNPGGETLIPWDELTAVRWDSSRAELILERASCEPVVLSRAFAGISGRELAESIAATKRRLAMNLVR
jgi:hypothetical protein